MLVLRIEGGLYTLNVRGVQKRILEQASSMDPAPRVVLLDAGATVDTSVTVLDVMAETDHMLQHIGSQLWVANVPTRAAEKARRTEMWDTWTAAGRVHTSVAAAVSHFERDDMGRATSE
jgi:anti-anti-sigma regulatory factor